MKDEITQLRMSLEKAIDEREGLEEKVRLGCNGPLYIRLPFTKTCFLQPCSIDSMKLKTVSHEVSQLRKELADEQFAKKESDVEVCILNLIAVCRSLVLSVSPFPCVILPYNFYLLSN